MNKYFVAVCDDEELALSYISQSIKREFDKSGIIVDITAFNEPKMLLESNRTSNYEVIFLDIDMPDLDGIETARIIKNQNQKSMIIFITGKDELVYKSFEVHPFGFIRKSKLKEETPRVVTDIIKVLSRSDYVLNFKIEGMYYKLLTDEIVYIESKSNYIIINTTDGLIYKYKDSINRKEIELLDKGFVRIHEKYLVNLKYIFSINKKSITTTQKYEIPVSRSRMNPLRKDFLNYYGRIGSGVI